MIGVDLWVSTTGARAGSIGAATSVSLTWRKFGVDTCSIYAPGSDEATTQLADPSRVLIASAAFKGVPWRGTVKTRNKIVAGSKVTWALSLVGPQDMVLSAVAWPVPDQPISNQTATAQWEQTGPAETVVKNLVRSAATRLGLPVLVLPDQGRGVVSSLTARMVPVGDVIKPVLDAAMMMMTCRVWLPGDPQPAGQALTRPVVLVDVIPCPTVAGMVWTSRTGLAGANLVDRNALTTRKAVGGPGDGTQRRFRQVIDTVTEQRLGPWAIRDSYLDSRGAMNTADGATIDAAMDADAADSLAADAASLSASVELTESTYHYGADGKPNAYLVGTRVTADAAGTPITNFVDALTVTCNAEHPEPVVTSIEVGEVVGSALAAVNSVATSAVVTINASLAGR